MPVSAGLALFVVDALPAAGPFMLTGPEGRHAATVRRMRVGERLALTDGAGGWMTGTVTAVGKDQLTLDLHDPGFDPAPLPTVTVVQALPKGDRSELAVDQATEAGADVLVPWAASRCVARWTGDKAVKGVDRWRQVAREAAKQSRRTRFPLVEPLHSTADLIRRVAAITTAGGTALVLHEAGSTPIRGVALAATEVLIVIGPEGGIADDELARLTAAGAHVVRLGPQVLRTSTAAAVALGALGVLTDRW